MYDPLIVYPSYQVETMPASFRNRMEEHASDPNTNINTLLFGPAGIHPGLVATNPTLLIDAISDPATFIRPRPTNVGGLAALAQHRDVPPELLRLLLTSEHPRVVAAAMKNPRITPELLEHAVTHLNVKNPPRAPKHLPTRQRIHDELYRRLPLDRARELTLQHLNSKDEPFPAVLTHPKQSFEEAFDYYHHVYEIGRLDAHQFARANAALIKHPQAPETFLLEAETSNSMFEWIALAEAPAATPGMLRRHTRRLLHDAQTDRLLHDRKRPTTHPRGWPPQALTTLAARTDLPEEAMQLILDQGPGIARAALAENSITPPNIIDQLLQDQYDDARVAAARHPNSSWDIQPKYINTALLAGMAQHRQLDHESRLKLIKHLHDSPWLEYLAKSPHTPKRLHKHLLEHRTAALQAAAVSNPTHTTTMELIAAATSDFITVQVAAANHPDIPDPFLLQLTQSSNATVNQAAKKALERNLHYGRNPTP